MRVLVSGAQGFAGRHLIRELKQAGHKPLGLVHQGTQKQASTQAGYFPIDLRDSAALKKIIGETQPEACIHLAGISFVPRGWTEPDLVFQVNVLGTIHMLEAFKVHVREAKLLIITSAEVYGHASSGTPLNEDAPLSASNLYAVSKMAADLSSLMYAQKFNMHVMTARPQNHIGPGQSAAFAIPTFATQLARMAKNQQDPKICVGNLDSERFFLDVRDVAKAYRLILERGEKGHAYNVGTTRKVAIREALETLCRIANVEPTIEIDPLKFRPTESPPLLDTHKLRERTGWVPKIDLQETLKDIYEETLEKI